MKPTCANKFAWPTKLPGEALGSPWEPRGALRDPWGNIEVLPQEGPTCASWQKPRPQNTAPWELQGALEEGGGGGREPLGALGET